MSELGTPALVVPVLAQQSPVSSSDILAEDVSEVPRFRARSRVQPLDSQMDFDSNEVGTVLASFTEWEISCGHKSFCTHVLSDSRGIQGCF